MVLVVVVAGRDTRSAGGKGARQGGRERAGRREGEREYLRIAADIMLICERGCMPDKPAVGSGI